MQAYTTPTATSIPQPARPVGITAERQKRTYTKLRDALTDAGCELIALGHQAIHTITESRAADARADERVERIDRLAYRGALEADALGEPALVLLFGRIRRECVEYRHHDSAETRLIADATTVIHRLCQIARGLNAAITRSLGSKVPHRRPATAVQASLLGEDAP